jgi:hypothetical protein
MRKNGFLALALFAVTSLALAKGHAGNPAALAKYRADKAAGTVTAHAPPPGPNAHAKPPVVKK